MELSCDEKILSGLCEEERVDYGDTMLDIVKNCKDAPGSLTTGFNPNKNTVMIPYEP